MISVGDQIIVIRAPEDKPSLIGRTGVVSKISEVCLYRNEVATLSGLIIFGSLHWWIDLKCIEPLYQSILPEGMSHCKCRCNCGSITYSKDNFCCECKIKLAGVN
jgi:hypothetical protein